ncbi:Uncharacterised protein [Lysinibacillus sphaericus]|nr:Uncharacterised protein [Lysinibacillus sphaericus]
MDADKLKQYIGLFGGLASAVFLFLHTIGIQFTWFNPASTGVFSGVLVAAIPFVLIVYGVYKNSYIITEKAKTHVKNIKNQRPGKWPLVLYYCVNTAAYPTVHNDKVTAMCIPTTPHEYVQTRERNLFLVRSVHG